MTGLSEEEILAVRKDAIREAREYNKNVNVLESYVSDKFRQMAEEESKKDGKNVNWNIFWLAQSLTYLSLADVVWLCDGWQDSIGCNIERDVAEHYGIPVLYPSSDFEKGENNG